MGSREQGRTRARWVAVAQVALLAAVSTALTLGGLELGLRATGHRALYEVYSKSSLFWRADPLLGWSHEPGAAGTFVGPDPWPIEFEAPVRINSLGLRGPEVEPPPPGGLRVLLLGDSMVAGFEVPYRETFGARLEARLARQFGAPVQVINAGVRGYGTDQSALYYRERGRALEPGVVVLFHSGNDPDDNVTLHRMRRPFGKPAFALDADGALVLGGQPTPEYPICSHYRMGSAPERVDGRLARGVCRGQLALFDHSALFALVAMRLQRNPQLVETLYHLGSSGARPSEAAGSDTYAARLTTALILDLARRVREDGAQFLLIGEDHALDGLDPRPLLVAGIEPHGVTPTLDGDPAPFRFRNDSHFNRQGHLRVSESISALVVAERPIRRDPVLAAEREEDPAPQARLSATDPIGG